MPTNHQEKQWQILAGDFNSPYIRNYIWTKGTVMYPKLFNLPMLTLGISSRKNDINYVGILESWKDIHEALKGRVKEDFSLVEKLIDTTNEIGESFNVWSNDEIFKKDLSSKSARELVEVFHTFIEKQAELYAYGILLPILDFQGFSFVEGNLEKFLKEKGSDNYQKYYQIFTQPLHNSFAQDQEESLLSLMADFSQEDLVKDITSGMSLSEIREKYPEFANRLEQHTEKYSWVYYVYAGPAFTSQHFLGFIRDHLKKSTLPKDKLGEIRISRENIAKLREQYIKELKPDSFNEMILRLTGKVVWAKPRRKDYQSRSYFHFEKLLKEIARRLTISLSQARSIPVAMMEKSLLDGKIDVKIPNDVFAYHICVPSGETVKTLFGQEALDFYTKNFKEEESKDVSSITELKGTTAHPGKARGLIKTINRPEDLEKMNEGDILLSVATTPSIVPAMKKAAAIITDEGGLTCHAAIVSRELGITCVVGTKFATKVFKDGDMVEVDAEIGLIRLLNKK